MRVLLQNHLGENQSEEVQVIIFVCWIKRNNQRWHVVVEEVEQEQLRDELVVKLGVVLPVLSICLFMSDLFIKVAESNYETGVDHCDNQTHHLHLIGGLLDDFAIVINHILRCVHQLVVGEHSCNYQSQYEVFHKVEGSHDLPIRDPLSLLDRLDFFVEHVVVLEVVHSLVNL